MKGTHTAIVYVQRPLKFQPLDKFSSSCENDDTCDETLTTKKKQVCYFSVILVASESTELYIL